MRALYALFSDPNRAQQAVDGLRNSGVADANIRILSSEPMEHYEFGQRDQKSLIWWMAAFGGVIGFLVGVGLTSLTQMSWPLNTGGMPIVSIWPNMIPIFELTMLGAILATVVTLLISAGLPSLDRGLYDPEVSDGKILIGVVNPPDARLSQLETALNVDGAGQVKKIP